MEIHSIEESDFSSSANGVNSLIVHLCAVVERRERSIGNQFMLPQLQRCLG